MHVHGIDVCACVYVDEGVEYAHVCVCEGV